MNAQLDVPGSEKIINNVGKKVMSIQPNNTILIECCGAKWRARRVLIPHASSLTPGIGEPIVATGPIRFEEVLPIYEAPLGSVFQKPEEEGYYCVALHVRSTRPHERKLLCATSGSVVLSGKEMERRAFEFVPVFVPEVSDG